MELLLQDECRRVHALVGRWNGPAASDGAVRTFLWPHRPGAAGPGGGSWSWPAREGGQVGLVECGGAVAVASVAVAARRGPLEPPGLGHPVARGGVGLEPVVEAAERGEVAAPGGARLWSAFPLCGVVELGDVVDVAAPGRS